VPELPEILVWARQLGHELKGKTISAVETRQPKCLNVPPEDMTAFLTGRSVAGAYGRGKWIVVELAPDGHLLLNLGMGGDFHYDRPAAPSARSGSSGNAGAPRKYQFRLGFADDSSLSIRFWWFGYVHAAPAGTLQDHEMTASLGPSPLDPGMTLERFRSMVAARPRRAVKSFILDQKIMAGIGNVYAQDSLWGAKLHPDRRLGSLSEVEVEALWTSIRDVLGRSVAKGGLAYERDFFGRPGGFGSDDFAVGYKEGQPCPRCGAAVVKTKTGPTSTYICPNCQRP